MTDDICRVDLRAGVPDPIALNLGADIIALTPTADEAIDLEVNASPINLAVAATVLQLSLAGTVQGPKGEDGAGAQTFGEYVAAENISSSSLTHISEIDGLLYLADYELDRPANSFTIPGCVEGESLGVLRSGLLYGLSGIVPGKPYWLGNSGQVRTTCPGHGVTQRCGDGSSATAIMVSISEDVDWE